MRDIKITHLIARNRDASSAQSDGEKSDQDLVVDDGSDGPDSPMVNGTASPRENGIDKVVVHPSMNAGSVQTAMKKDITLPQHSPRSGTSSNASTPSAKKMEDREKPTTPISKPLTPTAMMGATKSSTSGKLLQVPPVPPPPAIPPSSVAAYPSSLHYPGLPPPLPPHFSSTTAGTHPSMDMMLYNGYVPRPALYDPHAALRPPTASSLVPGSKP